MRHPLQLPTGPRFYGVFIALNCALIASGCGTETTNPGSSNTAVDSGGGGTDGGATTNDAGSTGGDSGATTSDAGATDIQTGCTAGDKRCNAKSPYAFEACQADGTWKTDVCPGATKVCLDGSCVDSVCPVGKAFCDKGKASQCAADGLSSKVVEDCTAAAKLCKDGACGAAVCTATETKCDGNNLLTCKADGSGWDTQPCGTGKACDGGKCLPTVCLPGETYCQDGKAVACNASRTKFKVIKNCKGLGLTCEKGECGKKICEPKKTKCVANKVEKCSDGGTSWLPLLDCTKNSQVCVNGGCSALVCKKGETACKGNVQLTCEPGGLKWKENKCATGDICHKGKCVTPVCKLPTTWSKNQQVFKSWKIATNKNDGCDIDGNGTKDNAFGAAIGAFAAQINNSLQQQVKAGTGVLLLEGPGYKTDSSKFDINVFIGNVVQSGGACSPADATSICKFKLQSGNYDIGSQNKGACPAAVILKDATVKSGKLQANGPKGKPFTIELPILLGKPLALNLHKMSVEGTVTDKSQWKTTAGGKLCGAIKKKELIDTLNQLPDSFFTGTGFSKQLVISLLSGLLNEDIDTDGNGSKDAISSVLAFTTGQVQIVGF